MDEIDEFYTAVTENGAEVTSPLSDQAWGMREFGIRTVDGHCIRFGSPIRERAAAAG